MFMYMNRIKRSVPLWCTAVLAMTMAACVDKDYDLGDVDKTAVARHQSGVTALDKDVELSTQVAALRDDDFGQQR